MYNYLSQNSKIAKMSGVKTFNWGIPAFESVTGFKTCPNAAACALGCYAKQGAYTFSNVASVFEKRLQLTFNGVEFIETIDAEIKRRKVQRLRVHDSGDFYSLQYTMNWFSIMRRNPDVQFYAYTKMISMFNMLKDQMPKNFNLIYSYGGTEDKLIDKASNRHSWVFQSIEQLHAAGYADASQDDSVALGDNPRIGLVYHGVKGYNKTNWNKVK